MHEENGDEGLEDEGPEELRLEVAGGDGRLDDHVVDLVIDFVAKVEHCREADKLKWRMGRRESSLERALYVSRDVTFICCFPRELTITNVIKTIPKTGFQSIN